MVLVAILWLGFFGMIMGWVLWKNYMKFYMMTNHPEKYMEIKERDDERMKQLGSEVAKAAGPLLVKAAERMLKK
jgi:hypothetical protein